MKKRLAYFFDGSTDDVGGILGILLVVVIILAAIFLMPFLVIGGTNTISEAAGSGFYIEHGILTYLAVIVVAGVIRSIVRGKS
jgi:hypothetical protein